jgi:hypothetical protein
VPAATPGAANRQVPGPQTVSSRADGAWGAFEVKLGTGQIDASAASLLTFADKVDTDKVGPPAGLA